MFFRYFPRPEIRLPLVCLAALACFGGCRPQARITKYTVPKPELIDPTLTAAGEGKPQQTLAAIVPVEKTGWFFKLTGPPDVVGSARSDFDAFIASLKFAGQPEPKPEWKMPPGWKEQAGAGLRFATISIPADPQPLELTVIPLPRPEEQDEQTFLLSNINRWREQLTLPPLSAEQMAEQAKKVKLGDYTATVVDFSGRSSGSGMSASAPFAGSVAGPALPGPIAAPSGADTASDSLQYTKPASWQEGQRNQFRKAAFTVQDGQKMVEITVIDLPPSSVLDNVNRWRGQIGLERTTQAELSQAMTRITAGGIESDYIELVGADMGGRREAIFGVIAVEGNRAWFIKLKGDAELAQREKANFEAFVRSLKFS